MFCKQYISQQELVNISLKWLLWIIFGECERNKADLHSRTNDAFHGDWMLLGPEDVSFRSYILVENDLQTCGFSSFNKLCDDLLTSYVMIKWVRGSNGEDENERWPWMSAEFYWSACYLWDLSFFYMHSTSKHDNTGIYAILSETRGSN